MLEFTHLLACLFNNLCIAGMEESFNLSVCANLTAYFSLVRNSISLAFSGKRSLDKLMRECTHLVQVQRQKGLSLFGLKIGLKYKGNRYLVETHFVLYITFYLIHVSI